MTAARERSRVRTRHPRPRNVSPGRCWEIQHQTLIGSTPGTFRPLSSLPCAFKRHPGTGHGFGSLTRWMISMISGPSGSEAMVCLGRPQPRSSSSSAARIMDASLVLLFKMAATFSTACLVWARASDPISTRVLSVGLGTCVWGSPSLFQLLDVLAHAFDHDNHGIDILAQLIDGGGQVIDIAAQSKCVVGDGVGRVRGVFSARGD